MDAAEDDGRSAGSREHADLVAAQRIAGVYADSDDIAGLNPPHIEGVERFIRNLWLAKRRRRRRRQDEQPPRRDDANAERQVTRIHQMNSHARKHGVYRI